MGLSSSDTGCGNRPCETALITVLPLFEFAVRRTLSQPVGDFDGRTRRLQTFYANFLAETRSLRHMFRDIIEPWPPTPSTDAEDYVETLTKILELFESLISDDIPGLTLDGCVKHGDQSFRKLHALQKRILEASNSLVGHEDFVTLMRKESRHEKILKRLTKYNRRIMQWLDDAALSVNETPEKESETSPLSFAVRGKAEELYRILLLGLKQTCKSTHRAKIRLTTFAHTESPTIEVNGAEVSNQAFDIFISTHQAPYRWRQSRVQVISREAQISQITWASQHTTERRSPLQRSAPKLISSICTVIDQSISYKSCLHIAVEDGKIWQTPPLSETEIIAISDQTPTVSLKRLLETAAKFSLKERRTIAVILAYSLLYLGESSWLRREWTKDDVCFLQTSENRVDVCRPYLSVDIPGAETKSEIDDEILDCPHLAPSILAFGILLIKLEFGKPIESLWNEDDLLDGKKNANTNLTAATRFLDAKGPWDDVYTDFKLALSACIKGNFLRSDSIVDDSSFQQALYSNVVVHLEDELFRGFGIRAQALDDAPYIPTLKYQVDSIVKPLALISLAPGMTSRAHLSDHLRTNHDIHDHD